MNRNGFSNADGRRSYREDRHHHSHHRRGAGSALVALIAIAVGVLLTLDNFGLADADTYLDYWPVLLIVVGISHILRPAGFRRILAGTIWMVVGTALLLTKLGLLTFDLWQFWPLILVLIGANMLFKRFRPLRAPLADDSNAFSATAVMGADARRITVDDFRGGDATAIMGGCEIDLRGAGTDGEPAVIECFAVWGGIEIKVPDTWSVECRGTAILGGFTDKTQSVNGGQKRLIVRGTAIMGGVEIKN